jgi:SAM-dependent methyltransferase
MTPQSRLATWPLPAVAAWLGAWLGFKALLAVGLNAGWAVGLATALGVAMSLWGGTWWRRLLIAGGFPLSLLLSGLGVGGGGAAVVIPAWGWLVPLTLLLLVYPLNAWRDAPLFPTPRNALTDLAQQAPLQDGALILDAGCGLGQGLQALRRAYPKAALHGLEWSWPLRWLCALLCPWARVRQGDIWRADWSTYDMVYLFQRPESMPRAAAKALKELRPGAWLVSLEFEAQDLQPVAALQAPQRKTVWVYRIHGTVGTDFECR